MSRPSKVPFNPTAVAKSPTPPPDGNEEEPSSSSPASADARHRAGQNWNTFDRTLSAIFDFVYTFDRSGRFLYANQSLLDLWNLKLEDAVGKNFFDLHYSEDVAARLQGQIHEVDLSTFSELETRYGGNALLESAVTSQLEATICPSSRSFGYGAFPIFMLGQTVVFADLKFRIAQAQILPLEPSGGMTIFQHARCCFGQHALPRLTARTETRDAASAEEYSPG